MVDISLLVTKITFVVAEINSLRSDQEETDTRIVLYLQHARLETCKTAALIVDGMAYELVSNGQVRNTSPHICLKIWACVDIKGLVFSVLNYFRSL